MSEYTDKELFARIVDGDQSAFTAVYEKYTGPLYFYALKLLKSEMLAEELVQEIFMHLWAKRQTLGTVENPGGFLNRMTLHKAIDWIRRHQLDLKVHYYITRSANTAANTTEEEIDFKTIERLIDAAVHHLSPQRSAVYKLKYEQKLNYDEISNELKISKHTVRNHLSKAFEAIRHYLVENGGI